MPKNIHYLLSHPQSIKEAWLVLGAEGYLPTFILDEMCDTTYSPLDEPRVLGIVEGPGVDTRGPCLLVVRGRKKGEQCFGGGKVERRVKVKDGLVLTEELYHSARGVF